MYSYTIVMTLHTSDHHSPPALVDFTVILKLLSLSISIDNISVIIILALILAQIIIISIDVNIDNISNY